MQGSGIQANPAFDLDSESMPYRIPWIMQSLPDWATAQFLRAASWCGVGSGVLLAVIAETPASVVATVLGGIFGVVVALINWHATRYRIKSREAALEAKVAALEYVIHSGGSLPPAPK